MNQTIRTTMKRQLEYVLSNETEVLGFLKSKYPIYHLSNVFFRDIQYGIQTLLDGKGMSVGYADAEKIATSFVSQLEKKKILNPIDRQSWVVIYPEYKKPAVKPAVKPAAKPAAPAPAVARPGSTPGAAKPSLPPLGKPAAGPAKPGSLPPLGRTPAGAAPTAKPAGLPPINRTPAGSATGTKSTGLPPLRSATPVAPKPVAQPAEQNEQAAQPERVELPEVQKPVAEAPKPAAPSTTPAAESKPIPPGGKKPLPPLRSSTPAGKK
jgi:hypothetical protein